MQVVKSYEFSCHINVSTVSAILSKYAGCLVRKYYHMFCNVKRTSRHTICHQSLYDVDMLLLIVDVVDICDCRVVYMILNNPDHSLITPDVCLRFILFSKPHHYSVLGN